MISSISREVKIEFGGVKLILTCLVSLELN